MLIAHYHATRPGLQGIANRLIRWRLNGIYSHTELVFEPHDNVGHWMPDGTCERTSEGLWSVSSVAAERLPDHSPHRAGGLGGVRLKRINFDSRRWDLVMVDADPQDAARLAARFLGQRYDWSLIWGYLNWLIPHDPHRWTCSELVAHLLGYPDGWRFDPCALWAATNATHSKFHPHPTI